MSRKALLLIVFIAFIGCDSNSVSDPPLSDIVQDDTESGMQMYLNQWNESGVDDYVLSNFRRCVCLENMILYTITVQNGNPVSATRQTSEDEIEPVPVDEVPYPTVESLFDIVAEGFDLDADSIGVRYSTANGRPDQITVDYNVATADEELELFVDDFQETN